MSDAFLIRWSEMSIHLVDVDETVLTQLVAVAIAEADPDDVTPDLGDGWCDQRVAWLKEFHRDRREGVGAPLGESTWAVLADRQVVGSVRLKRDESSLLFEVGIWLSRLARGRGIGMDAINAVVNLAPQFGATTIYAETTVANVPAQALLRRLGFALAGSPDGTVRASRPIQ